MTDTLLIRLAEQDDARAGWLLVDALGARLGAVQSGPLSAAAVAAAGHRVVVLVPGVEVLLVEPLLPVRGGARLAQVVPFALEEHLADDVEGMHFAIGRPTGSRPGTPVATVARARMDSWLAQLRAVGIEPTEVYPDSAVLPSNPGQTVLLIEADRLYGCRPDLPPFVLHAEPLSDALELVRLEASDATTAAHVIVYITQADWQRHQATLEALRDRLASMQVQLLPDGALPLLARQAITQPPFSLLQGDYAPRSSFSDGWRNWRVAAVLFACLIGLNLAARALDIWTLTKRERALDASIEQVFRSAMPGEQNAVDARRRMEARLAAAHGSTGSGPDSLLGVLGVLGGAFAQVPGATLEALSFRGNVTDMQIAAKDVGSLDQVQHLVADRGLSAELQSSNPRAEGVQGRIQIKGRGAT